MFRRGSEVDNKKHSASRLAKSFKNVFTLPKELTCFK